MKQFDAKDTIVTEAREMPEAESIADSFERQMVTMLRNVRAGEMRSYIVVIGGTNNLTKSGGPQNSAMLMAGPKDEVRALIEGAAEVYPHFASLEDDIKARNEAPQADLSNVPTSELIRAVNERAVQASREALLNKIFSGVDVAFGCGDPECECSN